MKRFLVMAVVLAAAMMEYRYIHPIGTVLGMFGVNIGIYAAEDSQDHDIAEQTKESG